MTTRRCRSGGRWCRPALRRALVPIRSCCRFDGGLASTLHSQDQVAVRDARAGDTVMIRKTRATS